MILMFEDHGQDFLFWTLDKDGMVINSQPFQYSIWVGCQVLFPENLKVGDIVNYYSKHDGELMNIKYPLEAVHDVPGEPEELMNYFNSVFKLGEMVPVRTSYSSDFKKRKLERIAFMASVRDIPVAKFKGLSATVSISPGYIQYPSK